MPPLNLQYFGKVGYWFLCKKVAPKHTVSSCFVIIDPIRPAILGVFFLDFWTNPNVAFWLSMRTHTYAHTRTHLSSIRTHTYGHLLYFNYILYIYIYLCVCLYIINCHCGIPWNSTVSPSCLVTFNYSHCSKFAPFHQKSWRERRQKGEPGSGDKWPRQCWGEAARWDIAADLPRNLSCTGTGPTGNSWPGWQRWARERRVMGMMIAVMIRMMRMRRMIRMMNIVWAVFVTYLLSLATAVTF